MADLRLALEIGDCGISTFPIVRKSVIYTYRDGELENYNNYTWLHGRKPIDYEDGADNVNGGGFHAPTNGGSAYPEPMDIDEEPIAWEGANTEDTSALDGVLDSCLAVP